MRNKSIKKNNCRFCGKTVIGNSFHFKSHLYMHNAVKPRFICKYCSKGYYRYDIYSRHLTTHDEYKSKAKARNVYICDYCDRSYVDKRNLIRHLRLHDDSVASSMTRFTCNACGTDYCEKRVLVNHIRREHFNQAPLDEPLHVKRRVKDSWLETIVDSDVCVQMTKVNSNIICIKKCGKIEKEKSYKSDKIDKKSKIILRTDTYTLYSKAICDYCNKEMLKKSILGHIRERHLNIRKFTCDICKRMFNRRYQMADHICGKARRRRINNTEFVLKPKEEKK